MVPPKFVVARVVELAVFGSRLERSSCAVRTEPQARRAVIDSCSLRLVLWCPSNQYLNIRTESGKVSILYVGRADNSDCQILRGYKCILAANYQKTREWEYCSGKTRSGEQGEEAKQASTGLVVVVARNLWVRCCDRTCKCNQASDV